VIDSGDMKTFEYSCDEKENCNEIPIRTTSAHGPVYRENLLDEVAENSRRS